jgi:2-hydroxycyclohexanecarboxyl-CoA dehydrogenase
VRLSRGSVAVVDAHLGRPDGVADASSSVGRIAHGYSASSVLAPLALRPPQAHATTATDPYPPRAMRLDARSALVTGGAKGIGEAIVRRLSAEGARVTIGDIDIEGAEKVAAEVGAEAVPLDVTDPDSARAAVDEAGGLDVLVNNAGTDEFSFFTDTDPGLWERLLAVNLKGVLACTHAALPGMQRSGYGRIFNIASEAGRVGSKGSAVYSAAKGGVIAFTKTIARENARFGITANAIAPGPIDTPLLRRATDLGELGERIIETMKGATQVRRLGQPDEVAAAVAFLASEESAYITGETLGVSGGLGMV